MKNERVWVQIGVSVFALSLLTVHLKSAVVLDTTALGLVALAALPWFSSVIESAKLGGLEVKFRAVEREQARQRREIDLLRFLIENFVTEWELVHLKRLACGEPFPFKGHEPFKAELRRLINFGLIEELPKTSLDESFYKSGDLHEILAITARGRDYLAKRLSLVDSNSDVETPKG